MPAENTVSNCTNLVLLFVIGVMIYILFFTDSNDSNKEDFDSMSSGPLQPYNINSQSSQPVMPPTQPVVPTTQPVVPTKPVPTHTFFPTQHPSSGASQHFKDDSSVNFIPTIGDNIVNEIVSDTNHVNMAPISTLANAQTNVSGPTINVNVPSGSINPSVYDFQPSDESSLIHDGTLLNEAFNSPIPQGSHTDTVNFNKGNTENYNAKDFLPKEINDEWFETDFSLAKYQLNDDKLINPDRYVVGINTVGQSLKNASYDIRGTVPNPKFVISPFNNSTIEPDFNLKPLC
jgi:hypothetical protein